MNIYLYIYIYGTIRDKKTSKNPKFGAFCNFNVTALSTSTDLPTGEFCHTSGGEESDFRCPPGVNAASFRHVGLRKSCDETWGNSNKASSD